MQLQDDTVWRNVKGIAARKDVSQREIADVLKVSRKAVSERMVGYVDFKSLEIKTLAEYFNVPVSEFYRELQDTSSEKQVA